MNFDIDDLLSKELITYSELETIKNELQAAIVGLHDEDDELQEVLKVIEALIKQCEDYYGDSLCSEGHLKDSVLQSYYEDIIARMGESIAQCDLDIIKGNIDLSGVKDDFIAHYTCVSIAYGSHRYYFYVI